MGERIDLSHRVGDGERERYVCGEELNQAAEAGGNMKKEWTCAGQEN